MTAERPATAGPKPLAEDYSIRHLRDGDEQALCELEWRAGQAFSGAGYPELAAEPKSTADAFKARFDGTDIIIAADASGLPAGFAAVLQLDDHLWIAEIAVDPDHGRKGVGSALLSEIAAQAARRALAGVALSTFREVPFNAPFYRRNGFSELPLGEAPAAFAERFIAEVPPGIDRESRLIMHRKVS